MWIVNGRVQRRIQTQLVNNVTVGRFVDRKILDAFSIQELGEELFALVEQDSLTALVLSLQAVEFISGAFLNKLIILDKKIRNNNGKVVLCDLSSEIQEVMVISRLNKTFEIRDSLDDALAAFKS